MMPSMRQALKGFGRRVTVQVVKQKVEDFEAFDAGQELERATLVMAPSKKIAIKPEGQRTWKWWTARCDKRLELGWFLKVDRDGERVYEVMVDDSIPQARIFAYELAEAPR